MGDYKDEYWSEAVSCALENVGKLALFSSAEIDDVAGSMRISAEMQSQAFGWDVADANLRASQDREKEDLRKALRREQAMVTCLSCRGTGGITTYGGTMMSRSACSKCQGHGRHDP